MWTDRGRVRVDDPLQHRHLWWSVGGPLLDLKAGSGQVRRDPWLQSPPRHGGATASFPRSAPSRLGLLLAWRFGWTRPDKDGYRGRGPHQPLTCLGSLLEAGGVLRPRHHHSPGSFYLDLESGVVRVRRVPRGTMATSSEEGGSAAIFPSSAGRTRSSGSVLATGDVGTTAGAGPDASQGSVGDVTGLPDGTSRKSSAPHSRQSRNKSSGTDNVGTGALSSVDVLVTCRTFAGASVPAASSFLLRRALQDRTWWSKSADLANSAPQSRHR